MASWKLRENVKNREFLTLLTSVEYFSKITTENYPMDLVTLC